MMLAVGLMIAAIFNLALTLLAFRWLLKPALTLLILAAAGTTYFMTQYGVLMDVGMLRNVMQTNPAEVADLLSPKLAVYLALLGALPVWLLWRTPVRYRPWPRELLSKLLVALACLALLAGVALANYQGLSSLFRNNKELRLQVTPSNPGSAPPSATPRARPRPPASRCGRSPSMPGAPPCGRAMRASR